MPTVKGPTTASGGKDKNSRSKKTTGMACGFFWSRWFINYSSFNTSTMFKVAALNDLQPMVAKATNSVAKNESTTIFQSISIRFVQRFPVLDTGN